MGFFKKLVNKVSKTVKSIADKAGFIIFVPGKAKTGEDRTYIGTWTKYLEVERIPAYRKKLINIYHLELEIRNIGMEDLRIDDVRISLLNSEELVPAKINLHFRPKRLAVSESHNPDEQEWQKENHFPRTVPTGKKIKYHIFINLPSATPERGYDCRQAHFVGEVTDNKNRSKHCFWVPR